MPQIGQEPGMARTTSGCMGQVYSITAGGREGAAGSKDIPQEGQAAGPGDRTSGHMGQTYPEGSAGREGAAPGPSCVGLGVETGSGRGRVPMGVGPSAMPPGT